MKRNVLYIVIICLSCPLLFYALISVRANDSGAGFKRIFVDPQIKLEQMSELQRINFDFAWKPTKDIAFFDYKDSLSLLKMDFSLKGVERVNLKMPSAFQLTLPSVNLDKLDSTIYLTNRFGTIVKLNGKLHVLYQGPKTNFDETNVISPSSIAVRSFIRKKNENRLELNKIALSVKASISNKYMLPKQVDGVFCADGSLDYDRESASLLYMYYYRGTFLCLDTNLKLKYKAKTIDTVTTAKIKLGSYKMNMNGKTVTKKTQMTPPDLVCRRLSVDENSIYIVSGLKADNENPESFFKNEPIDVYALKDGKYLHSFYLPKYRGLQLRQFKVKGNYIIAVYNKYIVTFNFKKEFVPAK